MRRHYRWSINLLAFFIGVAAYAFEPDEYYHTPSSGTVGTYVWERWWVDDPQFIPPTASWPYPTTFLYAPATQPQRIKVQSPGWNAAPTNCESATGPADGHVVVRNCAGHYPTTAMHEGNPWGVWTWFQGNSTLCRTALSLYKAEALGGDAAKGWMWEGSSYAAMGGILNAMALNQCDPYWHDRLAVIAANLPSTLFVKNFPQSAGQDYAPYATAWEGLDRDTVDFRLRAADPDVQQKYFKVHGSARDTIIPNTVFTDFEFFDLMDEHDIAGYALLHDRGHQVIGASSGINLPWGRVFYGDSMDHDFDDMTVAFSNSSEDRVWCAGSPCDIGWFRLGLEYDAGSPDYAETANQITVPLRYSPWQQFIAAGVPPQGDGVTFDITIRKYAAFGSGSSFLVWGVGTQTGWGYIAPDKDIHIRGIQLHKDDGWETLTIQPAGC